MGQVSTSCRRWARLRNTKYGNCRQRRGCGEAGALAANRFPADVRRWSRSESVSPHIPRVLGHLVGRRQDLNARHETAFGHVANLQADMRNRFGQSSGQNQRGRRNAAGRHNACRLDGQDADVRKTVPPPSPFFSGGAEPLVSNCGPRISAAASARLAGRSRRTSRYGPKSRGRPQDKDPCQEMDWPCLRTSNNGPGALSLIKRDQSPSGRLARSPSP